MRNALSTLFASTFVLGPAFISPAFAAGATDPEAPPATVAAAPAPPASTTGVGADPNIDRGILLPTAMTQTAGSLTYNNYELLLHGITYGVTDHVQTTFTVLAPIVRDMPFVGFASIKGQTAVGDRLHLALQGTLGYANDPSSTVPGNSLFTLGAGGFASVCLARDCASLLSASASYELAFGAGQSDGGIIVYGASLIQRLTPHVKLLAELTSGAVKTPDNDLINTPGFLASYALRFHTSNIAGDVGFIKPVGGDSDSAALLLGVPFVSFSYRWN
jgi:hypothetical protein